MFCSQPTSVLSCGLVLVFSSLVILYVVGLRPHGRIFLLIYGLLIYCLFFVVELFLMDRESVQYTNDEATGNKAYAVRLGYWVDPYIKTFCPIPVSSTPEISRGYFVRVQTFEAIVTRFIQDCDKSCQIVNFGAGSDTLYFRLKDRESLPRTYVELDLPANVKKKIFTLKRSKILQSALASGDSTSLLPSGPTDRAKFGSYHILSFDLQSDPASLIQLLCDSPDGPQLSPDLPTLFLAECVLVYIPTKFSNPLLSILSSKFSQAAFLNYEQVSIVIRCLKSDLFNRYTNFHLIFSG